MSERLSGMLLDARSSPVVAAIAGLAGLDGVDLSIDRRDDMLEGARAELGGDLEQALVAYVRSGLEIAECWQRLLAQLPERARVLDFASGYGRVTRFLLRAVSPEQLTVADVDADAVASQHQRFGVETLVAPRDPSDFTTSKRFDLILVTSLFTHLPLDLARAWLRRLIELLEEDGVLAFTVHDPRLLDAAIRVEDGFHFEPTSESRVLELERYGSAWIAQQRLRALLAELIPTARVSFAPRIFGERQDLVVVDRAPARELEIRHPPFAYLEHAALGANRLALRGWGLDFGSNTPLAHLEARVGGRPVESTLERFVHPEVARRYGLEATAPIGFRLELPVEPLASATAPIVLLGTTAAGVWGLLEARTLEGYLLRSAQLELGLRADDLRFWRGRFAEVERAHINRGIELARVEAELAATRASRFWKLRELWFRLKRRLGFPAVG